MGYIKHHAIIVTTSINELMKLAHEKAKEIFKNTVSEIVLSNINGFKSFFIAPDGSKEGWGESKDGDIRRDEFIDWINKQSYEDGSNSLFYAELFYGEDNSGCEIVSHN